MGKKENMREHSCNSCNLDVRSVANILIDEAFEQEIAISNFVLNKSLYLIHSDFLHTFDAPLVSAKIEAWKYGPVFREIYTQFKEYGRGAISSRAKKYDWKSDRMIDADDRIAESTREYVIAKSKIYLSLSPQFLFELTHRVDGAWDYVFNRGTINFGMEITNKTITELEPEDWSKMICKN